MRTILFRRFVNRRARHWQRRRPPGSVAPTSPHLRRQPLLSPPTARSLTMRISVPRSLKAALAASLCLASMIPVVAHAATDYGAICTEVLKANAFNTYDMEISNNYKLATLDAVCSLRWTNFSDLENQSRSIDTGGHYGLIGGFIKAGRTNTRLSARLTYDNTCTNRQESLLDEFFLSTHSVNSDYAVSAWDDCVTKQANRFGLFSEVIRTPGSNEFKIEAYLRPSKSTDTLVLTGFDPIGYKCNLHGKDLHEQLNRPLNPYEIITIGCEQLGRGNISVSIDTDVSGEQIGPFILMDVEYEDLIKQIEALDIKIENLNSRWNKKFDALTLDEIVKPIEDARISAANPNKDPNFIVRDNCPDHSILVGYLCWVQHSGSGGWI